MCRPRVQILSRTYRESLTLFRRWYSPATKIISGCSRYVPRQQRRHERSCTNSPDRMVWGLLSRDPYRSPRCCPQISPCPALNIRMALDDREGSAEPSWKTWGRSSSSLDSTVLATFSGYSKVLRLPRPPRIRCQLSYS